MTIGEKIKYCRKQIGITQDKLAELTGIHPVSIRKYETNKMQPQPPQLEKIAAAEIAKALNSSYYHHGYAVGRSEAKSIGLNIVFPDPELETLMWNVWCDYSDEMKCGSEFNIVTAIMTNPTVITWLNSATTINLPVNTPPPIAQNIIGNLAQQSATITPQPPIQIKELVATIESPRSAMAIHTTFSITYWRDANMALSFNATQYSEGWKIV